MPPTGTPNENPGDGANGRAGNRLAAFVGLVLGGLILTGCGGEQVIGNDAAGPVMTPRSTTTTIPETTTTIDFDRPVSQGQAPLDSAAGPGDVADLVAEIRGQTADVDAQVRRLAPFPDLAGPSVAQILDIAVTLAPPVDEDHPSAARVRYRVPETAQAVADALDDELRALGWFKADQSSRTTDTGTAEEMVFRMPGVPAENLELLAIVEQLPGVTVVDLEYVVNATVEQVDPDETEGATYLERLSAWQEKLPLPRAADLVEVRIETAPEEGTLTAFYHIAADEEADVVAAVLRSIGSQGYLLPSEQSEEPPTAGPLELVNDEEGTVVMLGFAPSTEEGVFEIEAVIRFPMVPLD